MTLSHAFVIAEQYSTCNVSKVLPVGRVTVISKSSKYYFRTIYDFFVLFVSLSQKVQNSHE